MRLWKTCMRWSYAPRRQASRRWRHRPWWLWSHQGDSPPSRRAPSTPSSRRRVSSDRSSSARGRRRGTGSDRDPHPPGASELASLVLLPGSTRVKMMPRQLTGSLVIFSLLPLVGGEDWILFFLSFAFGACCWFGGGRTTSGGTFWAALREMSSLEQLGISVSFPTFSLYATAHPHHVSDSTQKIKK